MKVDIKKFLAFMNPLPPVGGLEISDSAIRFILLEGQVKPITVALRLPQGIIAGGTVKNQVAFIDALKDVHRKIGRRSKTMHVVLTLPPHLVYTQSFAIPFLPNERLDEAARLNLQMLSPMEFDKAYTSWQKVGENFVEGGQIELLGSFAERSIVDAFMSALQAAGFMPVAVEFPSLALSRVIAASVPGSTGESYLSVHVAPDGTSLAIQRKGNLHFNHFHSWASIQEEMGGKQLSQDDFKSFLVREMQKVLNFYTGKWGGTVSGVVVAASGAADQIAKLAETNFGLPMKAIVTKEFPGLDPLWFVAFGAALRGLVPRGDDTFVSLTGESVQVQYREARTLSFISLWRNIAITAFAFILLVFAIADFFIIREAARVSERTPVGETELSEVRRLEASAKEFNRVVTEALAAKSQSIHWSEFLETLSSLSLGKVTITKISVLDAAVSVTGSASGETGVLAFRDALANIPNFSDVTVPLEGIKSNIDGSVEFTLSLRLKSLEF